MPSAALYERIGSGYREIRRPDPRLAARIWEALGDARTVLNVGAGTGSYEPRDRDVLAVEPAAVMIAQRPPGAAPVIQAHAEALPFADSGFDAAMAILTVHHWCDAERGLAELVRVSRRRVVLVSMDLSVLADTWLVHEYLPELMETHARRFPSLGQLLAALPDARASVLPVPRDCSDGFMAAFWGRPEAYLDARVRAATSPWYDLPDETVGRALGRLRADLASGAWDERHGQLRDREELDVGLRLIHVELPAPA